MTNYVNIIGPVKDNQQSITITKQWQGSGNMVVTTPEKVDEYVSNHKAAKSKDNKRTMIYGGIGGTLGAVQD